MRIVVILISALVATARLAAAACTGDCNRNHLVTVDELVAGVGAAPAPVAGDRCPTLDADDDGQVSADELLAAVGNALGSCSEAVNGCNGAAALCGRPFDEVAYATAHNAMSNVDDRWTAPNQHHGISWQLADGVRGLMLDVYNFQGNVYLCHGFCGAGRKLLVDGLAEIAAFLDRHPREVVSIIFESYVSAADVVAAFEQSGLIRFVHAQPAAQGWPTLLELIDADERLVVFTDKEGGAPPWYHDVWAYAWETHFHFELPEDFSCALNRGDQANSLFILNHFLTNPVASPQFAEQVNFNPLFIDRAAQCRSESGRLPNFVTVDFYDIGDLFAVVGSLNGL